MSSDDETPYLRRLIEEIKASDVKILIIGRITQLLDNNRVTINDGTGEATIIIKDLDPILDTLKKNMTVKVLGQIKGDTADLISADIVADYSDLNLDLYQKSVKLSRQYLE